LVAAVRSHRPDDEVTVTYTRSGQSQTTKAKLGSDNGNPTG
jgi:putative serine protease PepD